MNEMKEMETLRRDNRRLCEALREISAKLDEINGILNGVRDLTTVKEPESAAPVSDDDVKSLLKKYSRLS